MYSLSDLFQSSSSLLLSITLRVDFCCQTVFPFDDMVCTADGRYTSVRCRASLLFLFNHQFTFRTLSSRHTRICLYHSIWICALVNHICKFLYHSNIFQLNYQFVINLRFTNSILSFWFDSFVDTWYPDFTRLCRLTKRW